MSRCLRCNAGNEFIEPMERPRRRRALMPVQVVAREAWRNDGAPEMSDPQAGEIGFDGYVDWTRTILAALDAAGYEIVRKGGR